VPAEADDSSGRRLADNLFRKKHRSILAALLREFGPTRFEAIEDCIQAAMVRALESWTTGPIPANPGGWLYVVARRRLIDRMRRADARLADPPGSEQGEIPRYVLQPLDHDLLRLIYVCAHPDLPARAQLALMLKSLCGLGTAEIATVLLSSPEAVKRMMARARSRIRTDRIPFDLPDTARLDERCDAILGGLYLVFSEGYWSHGNDHVIQRHLCTEAIKLTEVVLRSRGLRDRGRVAALLALMNLQGSRLGARLGENGRLLRLHEQDRSLWDRGMIARGIGLLQLAATSPQRSTYHLQAAIAAHHAIAPDPEATDWVSIRHLYDDLLDMTGSAVVALNRAVATARIDGPRAGLAELAAIEADKALRSYPLLTAIKADLLEAAGAKGSAVQCYQSAIAATANTVLRVTLQDRLEILRMTE